MIEEDIKTKLRVTYKFDSYLMHLIQEVTKRSPAEIVNFFYELTNQVCTIGLEAKKSGRGIRKNITDYFPGTSIPFHMLVVGHKSYSRWNHQTQRNEDTDTFSCVADVGFPESRTYMKADELQKLAVGLMEKSLLGGDDVIIPDFIRPNISTPKIYQDLMDSFAGRPPKEKKRRAKSERTTETT